jgi:hypothetical protein
LAAKNKEQKNGHPKWKKHSNYFQTFSFIFRIENKKVYIKEDDFENEYDLYTVQTINELLEKEDEELVEINKGFILFNDNTLKIQAKKKIVFRFCIVIGKISDSTFANVSFFKSKIDAHFELCSFNDSTKNSIAQSLSISDSTIIDLSFSYCNFINIINIDNCKKANSISFNNCSNEKGVSDNKSENVNKLFISDSNIERFSINTYPTKPNSNLYELEVCSSKINNISIENTDIKLVNFTVCEIGVFICRGSINSLDFISSKLCNSIITTLPENIFKNPHIIKQIKIIECEINYPLKIEKFKGEILDLTNSSFNEDLSISFDKINSDQNNSKKIKERVLILNHSRLNKITKIDTTVIDKLFFLETKCIGFLYLKPLKFIELREKFNHYGYVKNNDKIKIFENEKNQYLMLSDIFKKNGDFVNEDLAWVEYMKVSGKLSKLRFRPFYKLLDILGKFGTSPRRITISIVFVWFLFSLFYGLFDKFYLGIINTKGIMFNQEIESIWNYLYFSIITFLTIGYGDIAPSHLLAKFIAGLEGFLGVFLIAYLTVSIFRKYTRK